MLTVSSDSSSGLGVCKLGGMNPAVIYDSYYNSPFSYVNGSTTANGVQTAYMYNGKLKTGVNLLNVQFVWINLLQLVPNYLKKRHHLTPQLCL